MSTKSFLENDQGEVVIAIAPDRCANMVHFAFGARVAWLAMPPDKAREIAAIAIKNGYSLTGYYPNQQAEAGTLALPGITLKFSCEEELVRIDIEPQRKGFSVSGYNAILIGNTIIRQAGKIDQKIFTVEIG